MLRRRKTDLVNGKPLIELPPKHINVVNCEFNNDESEFYLALENKIEEVMNKFMKSGDLGRNYTTALVLLLRLRQGELLRRTVICTVDLTCMRGPACNHPLLVTKDYNADRDAVAPKPISKDNADEDDELADALAAQMGALSVRKECQLCCVEYVLAYARNCIVIGLLTLRPNQIDPLEYIGRDGCPLYGMHRDCSPCPSSVAGRSLRTLEQRASAFFCENPQDLRVARGDFRA